MKLYLTIITLVTSNICFAQNIDSTQYNIGHNIGENIPVVLLLTFAIFFIYRSYKGRNKEKTKTDFMNDGTIEKND